MVFPRADVLWGHGNTTTPPPNPGWGGDLEVRGGGGSWYSCGPGGGGGWYFRVPRGGGRGMPVRGLGGTALPMGIPPPRPPSSPLKLPENSLATKRWLNHRGTKSEFFECAFGPLSSHPFSIILPLSCPLRPCPLSYLFSPLRLAPLSPPFLNLRKTLT